MKPVLWVAGKDPGPQMREAGAEVASRYQAPSLSRSLGWAAGIVLVLSALAMGALLVVLSEGIG